MSSLLSVERPYQISVQDTNKHLLLNCRVLLMCYKLTPTLLTLYFFHCSLQLEESGVPLRVHSVPSLHLWDPAQLRVHPGPGGRVNRHPSHLCLPPLLLHAAGRHVTKKPSLYTKVYRTNKISKNKGNMKKRFKFFLGSVMQWPYVLKVGFKLLIV